jgi:hypothetical protein
LDYDAEKFKEARHKADEAAGQKTLEHPSRPTLDAYTAEVMRKAVENREWRNAVSAEANAKRDRNLDDEMQAIKIYKQNITRRELGLPELEGGWK